LSEFHRLLLGLHAQARRIDRDQALLGAFGVGAMAYIHQVESVHRMLTGTSCRWLLADEVGLGKTIQAIMVMRALAAQSPRRLNVALVVPDDLVGQWAEELLTRGHVLPIDSGQEGLVVGNLALRLARPSQLVSDRRLIADETDLLIIDEFTRLQVQVQHDLVAAARTVPNVIVLTATPALHLADTRRKLMALIEPEADRVAQAEKLDILKVLADREERAIKQFGGQMQEVEKWREVEEAYGLYRRLIRTARIDYPEALPRRNYQPIRVPPTDGDVGRAKTTRGYLEAARNSNLAIDHNLLLQVAGRSPVSLRERLRTLRRPSPALQSAWQKVDHCLREEFGDAKLDVLIDHLCAIHHRNRHARVVVVAEDNPTTSYLREAIEKLAEFRVASKRRTVEATKELEIQVVSLKDALDDFISGEAKVLVAADAAREGHNLQFADEIIFFALPWSPSDIQQWIGRIDRLGTKGQVVNRRIAITPIVIKGSIEDHILEVLEGTGVFMKSEVFDESEWEAITKAISAAIEGGGKGSWADAVHEAEELGESYGTWLKATRLPPSGRTAIATRCGTHFKDMGYSAPITRIEGYPWDWHQARERAVETMIKLACEDYLEVRHTRMGEQRFGTIWYKNRPNPDDFIIPDLDTSSSWYRQAYIARRSEIECPPRTHVIQSDGEKRRLNFFDHGCSLHDGAVVAFEKQTPATGIGIEFVVEYPIGHTALQWEGHRLLVATAELDLSDSIDADLDTAQLAPDPNYSKPERDAQTAATLNALVQFQADRRWMINLAPPEMLVAIHVEDGDNIVAAKNAEPAIFEPFQDGRCPRQIGQKRKPKMSNAQLAEARSIAVKRLTELALDHQRHAMVAVRTEVERRIFSAKADADDQVKAARAELAETLTRDSNFDFNRAAQRGAALALELADANWVRRAARLNGLEEAIRIGTKIVNRRMFWILPKAPSEENQ
jgi:ATP-dependent helicase HepA